VRAISDLYAIYLAAKAAAGYNFAMSKSNDITSAAGINRREFITLSARVGLAAGSLVIAANVLAACGGSNNPPHYVQIGNLSDFAAGTVVSKTVADANGNNATIFVENIAGQSDPLVLSDICSHNGCHVQWVEGQGIFGCPCHGGQYNKDGTVKAGPPPAPLTHLQVKVEGGVVSVLV
jgi:Rieske Fe-S protein